MTEPYLYAIAALLPLTASMLVFQTNPYNALILRGILGAVAALMYAVLGAADVALTEALMGTLLAITLYAVAVRSSMVMRLGVLEGEEDGTNLVVTELREIFSKQYLRLELVLYKDIEALHQALADREVHTIIELERKIGDRQGLTNSRQTSLCQTTTRIQRLYTIMKTELAANTLLTYFNPLEATANLGEIQS
jgi:putative multicomponent Na+:H+ antiporter subunit B